MFFMSTLVGSSYPNILQTREVLHDFPFNFISIPVAVVLTLSTAWAISYVHSSEFLNLTTPSFISMKSRTSAKTMHFNSLRISSLVKMDLSLISFCNSSTLSLTLSWDKSWEAFTHKALLVMVLQSYALR